MKLNDAEFLDDLERRVEANDWTPAEIKRFAILAGRLGTTKWSSDWVRRLTSNSNLRRLQIRWTRDWIIAKIATRLTT